MISIIELLIHLYNNYMQYPTSNFSIDDPDYDLKLAPENDRLGIIKIRLHQKSLWDFDCPTCNYDSFFDTRHV